MNQKLFVIDLDRTLIDTDKVINLLVKALNNNGYDGRQLTQNINKALKAKQEINAKHEIDNLGSNAWSSVEEYFLAHANRKQIVFTDARVFLNELNRRKYPYIILTFGLSREWQKLKLKASGLDNIPFIITNVRAKGPVIEGWKTESHEYVPHGFNQLRSKRIVLVDDKINAFEGFKAEHMGYLIVRENEAVLNVIKNVKIVNSLVDIEI